MITPEKIEEWIREAEERPFSGPLIIRFIASRLSDLTKWNEELLAENIELRSGKKAEEYERRIANLEYQVELLKRQLGGEVVLADAPPAPVETTNLLLYTPQGQVLRVELPPQAEWKSGGVAGCFAAGLDDLQTRLLAASSQEELLLAFDTGRTVTLAVRDLPAASDKTLRWEQAFVQAPVGSEELATILPIGRMSLFDSCVQISRRGFVKKIKEGQFETYIGKAYIGSGVKLPADKGCGLVLCKADDRLVMISQEGFVLSLEVSRLPLTIEETIRLGISDHVMTTFTVRQKPSILIITQNGKAIHREAGWLENAATLKAKGQAAFSQERRQAGVRVAGAVAADSEDWGAALHSDGQITLHKISDLISAGSLGGNKQSPRQGSGEAARVVAFSLVSKD